MLCCVALRCVALRCVALRCVALRCVALRCVALRCVALRCVAFALRCVALRCVALRCVALRCVALRCVALRCVALRCVALRCVALRCVALRCVALRCVALRCIVTYVCRFQMDADVWQFELNVDSCTDNDAYNGTLACPLVLYVKAQQIPTRSTSGHFVDCSMMPPGMCVLKVFQPAAGQLYYLMATTLYNVTFSVSHQSRGTLHNPETLCSRICFRKCVVSKCYCCYL